MMPQLVSIGVTGHRDIAPGESTRGVKRELLRAICRHTDGSRLAFRGVSCLAAGADQLFAEATLELGGDLVVFVPCLGYESTLDRASLTNYHRLLNTATEVVQLGFIAPEEAAFAAASERLIEDCDVILAVWDGEAAAGHGGTANVVEWARRRGRVVDVIWPSEALRASRHSDEEGAEG